MRRPPRQSATRRLKKRTPFEKKTSGTVQQVRAEQVAAFRLGRHGLVSRAESDPTAVCAGICGVQAQLTSSAHMALWVRTRNLTTGEIEAALWKQRRLVKTLCMRRTLHWIPAAEFSIYMAALRRSRVAAIVRVLARFGITQAERDVLNEKTVEALAGGPLPQHEITRRVRPQVSRRVQAWMDRVSSPASAALTEGLICYGPESGREITLVRVDRWLPAQKHVGEEEAKRWMLMKYLRAYGPAMLRDFSHWSGIPVNEARKAWEACAGEIAAVAVEGAKAWIAREDMEALADARSEPTVRLLPAFDPYLLAHAEKDHLVEPRFYKRVFCGLGRVSPVLLLNGMVAGTWSHTRRDDRLLLELRPFGRLVRPVCERIETEAESLGRFLGAEAAVQFSREGRAM